MRRTMTPCIGLMGFNDRWLADWLDHNEEEAEKAARGQGREGRRRRRAVHRRVRGRHGALPLLPPRLVGYGAGELRAG